MSHSPELQDQFVNQRDDEILITQFGVSPDQLQLLREGNLEQINQAVADEHTGEPGSYAAGPTDTPPTGPVVTHWIRVAKWITTADEPDDDEPDNDNS